MNAPYSEGPLDAKICLIGEAPGQTEVLLQRPFVGSSGQLLNTLLQNAGIQRTLCRIDNVVQERPYNNDITQFIVISKKGHPATDSFRKYSTELVERLTACSANVFVPLGNVPLYVLTGMTAVTKRRGSILSATAKGLEGRKVIPTIHPSMALRQYLYTHMIGYDLRRIKQESEFPEVVLPQRTLLTMPNYIQVMDFLSDASKQTLLAADIEVKGNEISHISVAISPTYCMSIPFVDGINDYWNPDQETKIWLVLTEIFEDPNITKVFHNAAFDTAFMYRKMGIRCHPIGDTMVGFAILFPDFPKGLDFLTSLYCNGEPYYKDDGKKYIRNQFGSEELFQIYNAKDSVVCLESYNQLVQDLSRQRNTATYANQTLLIDPLTFMQERGIRMDLVGIKAAADKAGIDIINLEAELWKMAGFALNTNSSKQMQSYFYGIKGYTPFYKKGAITTDDMAMKRLARKGCAEADLVRKIRELKKMKGTYYEIGIDPDGRLRCSFNPVGTKSTRLSSSKTIFDTGGNLQNQPPEMLAFMLADPGYVICKFDLGQAENRVVAYVSNCQRMINAFETGQDVHRLTAGLIFGIPPEEVSDEPGSCEIGGGVYSQRFWGKKANHGLNYDLGYRTFAMYYEIPESEAKYIVERYHSGYQEIRQWHAIVQQQLRKDRTLMDCFGEYRTFIDRWGDDLFKEAYSWQPQSTIAKKTNRHGVNYIYYNPDIFGPVELLNQVHDAIYFQIPLSEGAGMIAWYMNKIKESLEQPLFWQGRRFVIPADGAIGKTMAHYKKNKDGTVDNPLGMHDIKEITTENVQAILDDLQED